MHSATAFYSDGLELIAEFLACSRPGADGIAAMYPDKSLWDAAVRQLNRWSRGHGAVAGDESALRITVTPAAWNRLYAAALCAGRAVAPDAIGMATRGAGGMLAELSVVPAMAGALQPVATHPALGGQRAPWLQLPWQPLQKLLQRDRLLAHEAARPRVMAEALPPGCAGLDAETLAHGFLLRAPGRQLQLLCPPAWHRAIRDDLGRHFSDSALLLFRLMFHSAGQGWGWDADSAQCRGLLALIDAIEASGLAGFGAFRDACAALAAAIGDAAGGTAAQQPPSLSASALLDQAVVHLAALWPQQYLHPRHPSRGLMAGWMAQVHEQAQIAPDALLGPGARVGRGSVLESGAVLHGGAEIGDGVLIPEGVVVAAGARVMRLCLDGVALPPGTVLRGSVTAHRSAQVGKQVVLGAHADIGAGVHLPDGIVVADLAQVRELYLGQDVVLAPGTRIEGSLALGSRVRVGAQVRFGADVSVGADTVIGDGLHLPRGIVLGERARVHRCDIAPSASIPPGTVLYGDLVLRRHTIIGIDVVFGHGADIGPGVVVPAGVMVLTGARIDRLRLNACRLPRRTMIGGNLTLGRNCRVGRNVAFEGDNRIASSVCLPQGLHVARGARIDRLRLGAPLPPGTVACGDIDVASSACVGRGVTLGAGAEIHASLPDGVCIGQGAVVRCCDVAGAQMGWGMRMDGDLYLASGVVLGDGVHFGRGVRIEVPCRIPEGLMFCAGARVRRFDVAPDVALPAGTRIGGSLRLGRGVQVGAGVVFGADVEVEAGVRIPDGARIAERARITQLGIAPDAQLPGCFHLHGDAVIGAGARLGDNVLLGRNVEIGPGVALPPGVAVCDGTRLSALRIAGEVALPAGTRLGGNLVIRRGARVGVDVELGADVEIGPHVALPDGVVVGAGASLRELCIAPDVRLPRGTRLCGDLRIGPGARLGQQVCLGAGVRLGAGVAIPDSARIIDGASIDRLRIAGSAMLGIGVAFGGNALIRSSARIGHGVVLGKNVEIGPRVRIPAGAVVADQARVRRLWLGPGVKLPALFEIEGDLCIGHDAVVGHGARFGADARVGAGAVIGGQARLAPGARVEAGARVEDGALLAAPDDDWQFNELLQLMSSARPLHAGAQPAPPADAGFAVWQAYLSRPAQEDAQQQAEPLAQAGARPASAPIAVPAAAPAHPAPAPGRLGLLWPFG